MSTQDKENFNFVQVSRSYLKQWRQLTSKNALSSEILMYLVEHMGRTSNAVICSYATLIEITGYSRTSVAKAIKLLKTENWIDTIKVGSATAYGVNERVFWQAGRNQRKYAIFSATVVASQSEQASDFREKAKEDLKHIPFIDHKKERPYLDPQEQLPPPDQADLDFN